MPGLRTHRTYDITVPAGGEVALHVAGQFVTCITSSETDFRLGLDEEAESLFFQGAHVGVEKEQQFRSVRVRNPSGAALTVTLIIGFGEFKDSRLSISAPLDILDRAGRLLGLVDLESVAAGFSQDRTRQLGGVDILAYASGLDQVNYDVGFVTNPGVNQIIADSGDLPAGVYLVMVTMGTSVNGRMDVAIRSADDAGLSNAFFGWVPANSMHSANLVIQLALNEEIELFSPNAITGNLSGSLHWLRLKS